MIPASRCIRDDQRYAPLIGKSSISLVTGRQIPIVADGAIDPAFGTGAVKVTPAHDPTDFEIGRRQKLESIDIMSPDAPLSEAVPEPFRGLDRFEARKRVVETFHELGLLEKVENHRHAVGHCYRCETIVEPRLSDQWFVRMAPLAKPALRRIATAGSASSPSGGATSMPNGWRTSATGASPGSSGGDTASRCGIATACGKIA